MKLIGRSPTMKLLNFRQQYIDLYPIALPNPAADDDTPRVAHPEVWSQLQAVAGRRMDGYLLYRHIKDGGSAYDDIDDLFGVHEEAVEALGQHENANLVWGSSRPSGSPPASPGVAARSPPRSSPTGGGSCRRLRPASRSHRSHTSRSTPFRRTGSRSSPCMSDRTTARSNCSAQRCRA
jgi:hypothetical protein